MFKARYVNFVKIVSTLLLVVGICSTARSPNSRQQTVLQDASTTVSSDANSTMEDDRTFDGDKDFLKRISEIAYKVNSSKHFEDKDYNYSSCIRDVQTNSTNITWHDEKSDGPEIFLFPNAVRQLVGTTVKMVTAEGKHKSHSLGEIVVVRTKGVRVSSNDSVLQIKFERKKFFDSNNTNWTCVYWNRKISKWSVQGIRTEFNPDFIICSSKHLSTFSVIMPNPGNNLYNETEDLTFHRVILTCTTRIGSGITICFLILVIEINYRKKTGNETRKILLHSTSALLLTHGIYQVHIFLNGDLRCWAIRLMKYYFALAYLLWTAAEGINMWRILLADVFNTKGHLFYQWYKIISWGIPLITASIGVFCVEHDGNCRLNSNIHYDFFFYFVPWLLILAGNMLLFIWTYINVTNKNRPGKLKHTDRDYVLALTQVFGISWCVVFPLLYFKWTQLLGEYLLAGIISTQGLLIFMVRGGADKNFRNEFKRRLSGISTWFRTNALVVTLASSDADLQKSDFTPQFYINTSTDTKISYITIRSGN